MRPTTTTTWRRRCTLCVPVCVDRHSYGSLDTGRGCTDNFALRAVYRANIDHVHRWHGNFSHLVRRQGREVLEELHRCKWRLVVTLFNVKSWLLKRVAVGTAALTMAFSCKLGYALNIWQCALWVEFNSVFLWFLSYQSSDRFVF